MSTEKLKLSEEQLGRLFDLHQVGGASPGGLLTLPIETLKSIAQYAYRAGLGRYTMQTEYRAHGEL